MSDGCVFCGIVSGKLPSCRIFEDEDVVAFMDIRPIVKGHALVVPKAHHETIAVTPVKVLQKLIAVVRKVAISQVETLKADGVNVAQSNGEIAGQVVPHIHFHVIPRFKGDGHSWSRPQGEYADSEEMQRFASSIKGGIAR